MTVTVTGKGTAKAKVSGNELQITGIALEIDSAVVVAVGNDDVQGPPDTVKWGKRHLHRRVNRTPAGIDVGMSVWTAASIKKAGTRPITATWADDITERVMLVSELKGANRISVKIGVNETVDTGSPETADTSALETVNDFALAYFCMEGPAGNDTVGTLEIKDAGSYETATTGQRDGTAGAPAISNIGIQEFYLQLTSCLPTAARITGATARKWVCALITMEPIPHVVRYTARAKCSICEQVLWCDDDDSSVACDCSNAILNPDGTGTNIEACTDAEHLTEYMLSPDNDFEKDVVIFVEI